MMLLEILVLLTVIWSIVGVLVAPLTDVFCFSDYIKNKFKYILFISLFGPAILIISLLALALTSIEESRLTDRVKKWFLK